MEYPAEKSNITFWFAVFRFCWLQTARGEKSAGFLQKVVFFFQTPDFFFLFLHLLAEPDGSSLSVIALYGVCEPVPRSRLPRRLALIQPGITPSSLATLACPISFASFHGLYFVFVVVLSVCCHFCSLLILLIISQILENRVSTFFIPHHIPYRLAHDTN